MRPKRLGAALSPGRYVRARFRHISANTTTAMPVWDRMEISIHQPEMIEPAPRAIARPIGITQHAIDAVATQSRPLFFAF